MKGDLTLKILERVAEAAVDMATLFAAIAISPYGAHVGTIYENQEKIEKIFKEAGHNLRQRRNFSKLMYKLKREGIITAKGKQITGITPKGKSLLSKLKGKVARRLPSGEIYKSSESSSLKVIIFDIPEKERRKRGWLRAVLKRLGFGMLQRSVWAGKRGIPEEFFEDIQKLRLTSYVEIFEVGKTGSLERVV